MKTISETLILRIALTFYAFNFFLVFTLPVQAQLNDQDKPVAQIFGKYIYVKDLDPNEEERKQFEKNYPQGIPDDRLINFRHDKLQSLIFQPIMDDFKKSHDVEVTREEVDQFYVAIYKQAQILIDQIALSDTTEAKKMKEEIEQQQDSLSEEDLQFAKYTIENWKTSKALYEEYGGKVIFQQSNPLEPVGAYKAILEEQQNKGNFEIFDPQYKERFWKYFLMDHKSVVKEENIDYSVPWWLDSGPQLMP
jgi:hypothetical protein